MEPLENMCSGVKTDENIVRDSRVKTVTEVSFLVICVTQNFVIKFVFV